MSEDTSKLGPGKWIKSASGEWVNVTSADVEAAERFLAPQQPPTPPQPTIGREALDKLEDLIELEAQEKAERETLQLKTDLQSELRQGRPQNRLAEFFEAIVWHRKKQTQEDED